MPRFQVRRGLIIYYGVGIYGDLCLFHVLGEPTELTIHLCVDREGNIVHYTIHGFKIFKKEPCVDFKGEFNIEIDIISGRILHIKV